jgi:hypothetical protein
VVGSRGRRASDHGGDSHAGAEQDGEDREQRDITPFVVRTPGARRRVDPVTEMMARRREVSMLPTAGQDVESWGQ